MSGSFPVIQNGEAEDREHYFLKIPTQDFAKFMASLLGQKQVIEKKYIGPFVVGRKEIDNLNSLIIQRVSQQNKGALSQFSIAVHYDDGSSVQFQNLEEFSQYAEVRPRIASGFHASWTFLLQFVDREIPERQQIEVTFETGDYGSFQRSQAADKDRKLSSGFLIRIEHTARSWGVDMESLLIGHLTTIPSVPDPAWRKRFYTFRPSLSLSSGFAFFAGACGLLGYALKRAGAEKLAAFERSLPVGADRQQALVGQVAADLMSGSSATIFVYLFGSIIVITVLSIWVGAALDDHLSPNSRGYLLLTDESNRAYQAQQSKNKYWWATAIGGVAFKAVLGIVLGEVFKRLVQWT